MREVVEKEVLKPLMARVIYPVSDSEWVSQVQVVPKKARMTVISNEKNELIPQWTVTGWRMCMSYPFYASTHRMHDSGLIVPHIRPKVFTGNHMSRIKHNYYISKVSKDYDDSQRNRTTEDSITPQERQPGQHVT
jgi:hypothetical protein